MKRKQQDITCYYYDSEGHKKPDCGYFNMELERNKIVGEKKKEDDEINVAKKFNMTSNIFIEDLLEGDGDVLCNV